MSNEEAITKRDELYELAKANPNPKNCNIYNAFYKLIMTKKGTHIQPKEFGAAN
ncbi:hypothetical protein JCM19233_5631 [Vibrio astriarenae]|nr:hypothetical protein JCM19233_5631 [Vibrio sp. C7]